MKGHKNKKATTKGTRNQIMETNDDTLDFGASISAVNKNNDSMSEAAVSQLLRPSIFLDEQVNIVLKPDKYGIGILNTNIEKDSGLKGGNAKVSGKNDTLTSGLPIREDSTFYNPIAHLEEQESTSEKDSIQGDFIVGKEVQYRMYPENKRKLVTSPDKTKPKIPKKDSSFIQEFPKMDFIQSGTYCGVGIYDKVTNTSASQTYRMEKSPNDASQSSNNREASYWRRKYTESCKEISNLKDYMIKLEHKLQQYAQYNETYNKNRFMDEDKRTDSEFYRQKRGYSSRDTQYGSHRGNRTERSSVHSTKKALFEGDRQTERIRKWPYLRDVNWGEGVSQGAVRYASASAAPPNARNPEAVLVKALDNIMSGLDKVVKDIKNYRYNLFEGMECVNSEEDNAERNNMQRGRPRQSIQLDYGVSNNSNNLNVSTNIGGGNLKEYHRIVDRGEHAPGKRRNNSGYQRETYTDTEDGRSQRNQNLGSINENIQIGRNRREIDDDLTALKKKIPRSAVVLIRNDERSEVEYSELLKKAREEINIENLGIIKMRTRRAFNGGIILEIFDENAFEKARLLAEKLQSVFEKHYKNTEISCPIKKVNLAFTNIIELPSNEEVISIIARESGCDPSHIRR